MSILESVDIDSEEIGSIPRPGPAGTCRDFIYCLQHGKKRDGG
jgi:hypothetical protein